MSHRCFPGTHACRKILLVRSISPSTIHVARGVGEGRGERKEERKRKRERGDCFCQLPLFVMVVVLVVGVLTVVTYDIVVKEGRIVKDMRLSVLPTNYELSLVGSDCLWEERRKRRWVTASSYWLTLGPFRTRFNVTTVPCWLHVLIQGYGSILTEGLRSIVKTERECVCAINIGVYGGLTTAEGQYLTQPRNL